WAKGYDGATIEELSCAMGISRPSLYSTFGSKEGLFNKVVDEIDAENFGYMRLALDQRRARDVAAHLLRGAVGISGGAARGCVELIGCVAGGPQDVTVRATVRKRNGAARRALATRLEKAKDEGDLPSACDPQSISSWLFAIMQGLIVQAACDVDRDTLLQIVDLTLAAWPPCGTGPDQGAPR
ncbi:TetR/AcrR family transcriptional regulator, partial [Sphingobium yanoikuyae]|uniref:TetR/AcrR family transcriptional regulator n=2 Tax=Sphingomonadaceae TaxID=41297 RepID=UPI000262C0A0